MCDQYFTVPGGAGFRTCLRDPGTTRSVDRSDGRAAAGVRLPSPADALWIETRGWSVARWDKRPIMRVSWNRVMHWLRVVSVLARQEPKAPPRRNAGLPNRMNRALPDWSVVRHKARALGLRLSNEDSGERLRSGARLSVVEGSAVGAGADYFSFAYSACACARTGTSGSASFHSNRNS